MPFKTGPVSLPGRRIIREAFEGLQQTVSPLEAKDFQNTTLEDVRKAALDIENQLAARRTLRNMRRLMPLFQGLEHYSQSIEVLCNGTPYLPWIWAPIKLILTVASDFVEALERIVTAYSQIAECLPRMEMLNEAFSKNVEFQETLAIFYSDILNFHRHAYLFVRRSSWKIFFLTSWGRFQRRFDTILTDIKAHEELIDKTANAVNILEASKMRESLRDQRKEHLNDVEKQEDEVSTRQYQAIVGWLQIDDTDQQVIFDSIASEAERNEGTCSWILKQPILVSWMRTQSETPFVWLQGNPGAGKSVLATQIDAFLRSSDHSLVVRHFCTYSYGSSIQFDQILRSLLIQLIRPNSDLINYVYEEFVLAKQAASIKLLSQLVRTICEAISPIPSKKKYVHIILDGLDECDVEKQGRITNLLETLISLGSPANSGVVKILISSRPTSFLLKRFRKRSTVSLADEKGRIGEAIEKYAYQKLSLLDSRFSDLGIRDADIRDLSHRVSLKSDGMFLWARLVLEYISSNIFYDREEVLRSVDMLPRELSDFYERILSQMIARLDPRSLGRIKSLLGWVAFARRPLTQVECRSAMAFGQGVIETPMMPPQYIFEMCMPLIQENKDSTFSFIHVSVKDHLKSPDSTIGLIEADTKCEHGVASITCLLAGFRIFDTAYDSNDRNLRILRGIHGFHIYATEYWLEDLLCSNAAFGSSETAALLCSTAKALADRLSAVSHPAGTSAEQELRTLDERLSNFADQRAVYDMLQYALMERSAKTNSDQVKHGSSVSSHLTRLTPQGLKDLLASYQASIRYLLSISSFPGITLGELEKFKREFRTAAFTCRVRNCPCATKGFADEKKLSEHERRHVQRIICTVPGCPYPPLTSSRALKAHVSKCHGITQRIAEVTRISTQKSEMTESLQRAVNNTDVAAQRRGFRFSGMAQQIQQQHQPRGSNHELEDYEMQVKLLKRQNEKRRMARAAEQKTAESDQSSFDGRYAGEPEQIRAASTQAFQQQPHNGPEQQQFGNHINAANTQASMAMQMQQQQQEQQQYEQYGLSPAQQQQLFQQQQQQQQLQQYKYPTNGMSNSMMYALRQQQILHQQQQRQLMEQQSPGTTSGAKGMPTGKQLTPQQLYQLRQAPYAQGINAQHIPFQQQAESHRRTPSELFEVPFVAPSPHPFSSDTFGADPSGHSPLLRPADAPLDQEVLDIGSFSIGDYGSLGYHGRSPSHSPVISPRLIPQQMPETIRPSFNLIPPDVKYTEIPRYSDSQPNNETFPWFQGSVGAGEPSFNLIPPNATHEAQQQARR